MTFVVDKSGNNPTDVRFPKQAALGDRQVTVTTAATLLSAALAAATTTPAPMALPAAAKYCVLQVTAFPIIWTQDGSTPSGTCGQTVNVGGVLPFSGDLRKLQLIGVGGSSIINVSLMDKTTGWAD